MLVLSEPKNYYCNVNMCLNYVWLVWGEMNLSQGMNAMFLTLLGCELTFICFALLTLLTVRIQLHCFKLNCRSISDGSWGNSLKFSLANV